MNTTKRLVVGIALFLMISMFSILSLKGFIKNECPKCHSNNIVATETFSNGSSRMIGTCENCHCPAYSVSKTMYIIFKN